MNRKKTFALLLLLMTVMIVSSIAVAQRKSRLPQRGKLRMEMMAKELDLTEEQQAQLKAQQFKLQKSAIDNRSKIQTAELELRQLMDAEDVDESKVKSKIEQIGKLKTAMRIELVQSRLDMKKVLTAEQLQKMETLKQERMQEFRERRGERQFRRDSHRLNWQGRSGSGEF